MLDKRLYRWEKDFTRSVVHLTGPIAVQSLVLALMHIVDNLMIGWLGEAQLAGVTQANRVSFLMQVTMFGVISGASVFTSQYWGARDTKGIHRTLGLATLTGLGAALLFGLPAIFCPYLLINLLIHEEAAVQAGAQYLSVIGFAYLIQALSMVQSAVLKSTEQVKLPMFASILAIVTNTLLNWLLIFGNWGFPELGVKGAAIATLIGSGLELTILVAAGYGYNLPNAARLSSMKFTRAHAKAYFKVVLPTTANEAIWSLGMVMYSVAYGLMGQGAVAAVSIYNNVEQLAAVVLKGVTHACAVLIGMHIGAGNPDQAQLTAKRMLLGGVATGVVIGLVVACVNPFIVSLFNVTPETAQSARQIITIFSLVLWAHTSASLLIVGTLRAGGDVTYSLVLDVLPVWAIGIPLVFIFGPWMGLPLPLVFALTRIEEIAKSALALIRVNSGKWIHNLVKE